MAQEIKNLAGFITTCRTGCNAVRLMESYPSLKKLRVAFHKGPA